MPISPGDIEISHQLNSQNKPIYIVKFLTQKVKSSLKKCVGLWKHNGVLSEFGKIRETGKMCHVMSIDE